MTNGDIAIVLTIVLLGYTIEVNARSILAKLSILISLVESDRDRKS